MPRYVSLYGAIDLFDELISFRGRTNAIVTDAAFKVLRLICLGRAALRLKHPQSSLATLPYGVKVSGRFDPSLPLRAVCQLF